MIVKKVSVPTSVGTLYSLTNVIRVNSIILQAPEGNSATVYINEHFELYPGTAAPFAITRLDQVTVVGTSGDYLNIVIL